VVVPPPLEPELDDGAEVAPVDDAARRPRPPRVPAEADRALELPLGERVPEPDVLEPDVLVRPRSAAPWRCATR